MSALTTIFQFQKLVSVQRQWTLAIVGPRGWIKMQSFSLLTHHSCRESQISPSPTLAPRGLGFYFVCSVTGIQPNQRNVSLYFGETVCIWRATLMRAKNTVPTCVSPWTQAVMPWCIFHQNISINTCTHARTHNIFNTSAEGQNSGGRERGRLWVQAGLVRLCTHPQVRWGVGYECSNLGRITRQEALKYPSRTFPAFDPIDQWNVFEFRANAALHSSGVQGKQLPLSSHCRAIQRVRLHVFRAKPLTKAHWVYANLLCVCMYLLTYD